jgi:hypothetical protein
MISFCTKRTISKAFFACCFVFLASIGFNNKVSASCGDYLRHNASILPKGSGRDYFRDEEPGKLPAPSTRCQNGNCGQAPPALPVDLVRIAKLDANHFSTDFFFVLGMTDKFESSDDKSPLQPSLDLADPPPRFIAL